MMSFKIFIASVFSLILLTGCAVKEIETKKPMQDIVHTYDMEQTVIALADVLAENLVKKGVETGNIAMTTFVQLNNFTKTSKFGRLLSESLFHELNYKGVKLLDFRAKRAISINAHGEFYLSRDVNALNTAISTRHILVGTYSKTIDNTLMINARIINTSNGNVISTSSVILHKYDCRLFNDCKVLNRAMKLTSSKTKK